MGTTQGGKEEQRHLCAIILPLPQVNKTTITTLYANTCGFSLITTAYWLQVVPCDDKLCHCEHLLLQHLLRRVAQCKPVSEQIRKDADRHVLWYTIIHVSLYWSDDTWIYMSCAVGKLPRCKLCLCNSKDYTAGKLEWCYGCVEIVITGVPGNISSLWKVSFKKKTPFQGS